MVETMTVIVQISDCFFMTYWSNFIISTGIVKLFNYPAIQPIITFIQNININIGSLCDHQTSTFMPTDSSVVLVYLILQIEYG